MITIGKPYIYEDNEFAYLKASITISEDTVKAYAAMTGKFKHVHWRLYENYPPVEWQEDGSGMWFAVPKEYKQYLYADRADAFVVGMLWYAMVTESDIKCEAPISRRMSFYIQQYLFPAAMKESKGYGRKIKLIAETSEQRCESAGGVGTGMSCGVDSLYTLQRYNNDSIPEEYRLTHLAYFNMGAIFHPDRATKKVYTMKEFYETTDRMSVEKCENAQRVADESNLKLLYVKSNLDSDYYRGGYGDTGVYRNCACVLALQRLFKKYYCSSGGAPEHLSFNLDQASEYHEVLLCDALSTEDTQFILSDYANRIEKIEALAHDKIAQKYLDVCFRFNSCGECSKCKRTLVMLDILGVVDKYSEVFDTNKFKKDRNRIYAWLLQSKDGDPNTNEDVDFAVDMYNYAEAHNVKIPEEAYKICKEERRKKTFVGRMMGFIKRKLLPKSLS